MKYADIDLSDFPVVRIKNHPIDPSTEQIESFFNELEKCLDQTSGQYIVVSDSSEAKWIQSEARIHIGKCANRLSQKYQGRNLGTIIVMDSVLGRMMLKGVNLVMKQSEPQYVVKNLQEAEKLAQEKLSGAGIAMAS